MADNRIGKTVIVTPETDPELFDMMNSLNKREAQEINENNNRMIETLSKGLADCKSLEAKVQGLCNATARIFDQQKQWAFLNDKHYLSVKEWIRNYWNRLKTDETHMEQLVQLRMEKCKRPLQNIPSSEVETLKQYWNYVDQLLPV